MTLEKRVTTVCLIDDDQIYAYGFKKLSQIKHYCDNLIDFRGADEAIAFLSNPLNKDNLPDVIFLDIDMPEKNGWAFLDIFGEIKSQLGKNISIYIVTSSVNILDIERAKKYPEIADYFIKPTNEQEMEAVFTHAA